MEILLTSLRLHRLSEVRHWEVLVDLSPKHLTTNVSRLGVTFGDDSLIQEEGSFGQEPGWQTTLGF